MAGGGGGGSATTSSGLPDWAQPYVQDAVKASTNLYDQGALSHVQGLNAEQTGALAQKKQLGQQGGVLDQVANDSYDATQAYRDAAGGTGLFGANALGDQTKALESTIGQATQGLLGQQAGNFSRSGNLGGARAELAANAAAQQTGGQLAAQELSQRRNAALSGAGGVLGAGGALQNQFQTGANTLGDVGSAIQQQSQNEGDAAYQGVQRLFGLYGSNAIGQQQTTQQSGGK